MKEIAFPLIPLQFAGKQSLSFWKSVANYPEKSWFFKSINIFKQQLKIIITQKQSTEKKKIILAGRVHAANWGKICASDFVIVFLVPILSTVMDYLFNACLLIVFKWPMPAERLLVYPWPLQNGGETQSGFWDFCLYFGLQPLQWVLPMSVLLRKVVFLKKHVFAACQIYWIIFLRARQAWN